MKFIHIADIHFDTPLVSLKNNRELIKKRRAEQKQVFKEVTKLAKEEKVDCLFMCGDLFEQKYIEKSTIEFMIGSLQLIPNVKVFIAPGNHDPFIKNSPYKTYAWPSNVKIFNKDISKISCGDVDIYGFGFEDYEVSENVITDLEIENPEKVNILVTHGNLIGKSRYNDLSEKDLEKFDYVALGHIHDKKIDNKIVYPGSLLACGFDECGEHGLVIGEISKGNLKYEFKNMEKHHFANIEVNISDAKIPSDVTDMLNVPEEDICRIILKGTKNIDIKEIEEVINNLYKNVCEIKNETTLPYDLEEIAKQKTLKGIFTKKMLELIEKEPENKEEIMKAIELAYASL